MNFNWKEHMVFKENEALPEEPPHGYEEVPGKPREFRPVMPVCDYRLTTKSVRPCGKVTILRLCKLHGQVTDVAHCHDCSDAIQGSLKPIA